MSFEQRLDSIQVSRVGGFKNTPSASATRRLYDSVARVGIRFNISSKNDLPFREHGVAYGFIVKRVRNLGRRYDEGDGLLHRLIFHDGILVPDLDRVHLQGVVVILAV